MSLRIFLWLWTVVNVIGIISSLTELSRAQTWPRARSPKAAGQEVIEVVVHAIVIVWTGCLIWMY